jgi:hypothetical protein
MTFSCPFFFHQIRNRKTKSVGVPLVGTLSMQIIIGAQIIRN